MAGAERESDVVMKVLGLILAGRDGMNVEIEDVEARRRQVIDA